MPPLNEKDSKLFFQCYLSMLHYFNETQHVTKSWKRVLELKDLPQHALDSIVEVRTRMVDDAGFPFRFAKENPYGLSEQHCAMILTWTRFVSGTFLIVSHKNIGTIFITLRCALPIVRRGTAYAVLGARTPIETMFPDLEREPRVVRTVLLPFGSSIVYDSIFAFEHDAVQDGIITMDEFRAFSAKFAGPLVSSSLQIETKIEVGNIAEVDSADANFLSSKHVTHVVKNCPETPLTADLTYSSVEEFGKFLSTFPRGPIPIQPLNTIVANLSRMKPCRKQMAELLKKRCTSFATVDPLSVIFCGHAESVAVFAGLGVDFSKRTGYCEGSDSTAIRFCCQEGREEVLEELLRLGCRATPGDAFIAAQEGKLGCLTLIHQKIGSAILPILPEFRCSAMLMACQNDQIDCIKFLLSIGGDIDQKDSDGDTPLMAAAHSGKIETIRFLLQAGANQLLQNNAGDTVLQIVTRQGSKSKHMKAVLVSATPTLCHRQTALRDAGNICFTSGTLERALQLYTEGISLDPEAGGVHLLFGNRSVVKLKLKDAAGALEDARIAVRLAPEWPKGHLRLCAALEAAGETEAAAAAKAEAERLTQQ